MSHVDQVLPMYWYTKEILYFMSKVLDPTTLPKPQAIMPMFRCLDEELCEIHSGENESI